MRSRFGATRRARGAFCRICSCKSICDWGFSTQTAFRTFTQLKEPYESRTLDVRKIVIQVVRSPLGWWDVRGHDGRVQARYVLLRRSCRSDPDAP